MKSISRYSQAFGYFIMIIFSLVIMNLISVFMIRRLSEKAVEEKTSDTYFFAGYELSCL